MTVRPAGGEGAGLAAGPPRLLRLDPGFAALGLVLDYLSASAGFRDYTLGQMVRTLRFQLQAGTHVCALSGERVVGYCGWLEIAEAQGQLWLVGLAELRPLPPGAAADAFAMTVVAADDGATVRRLMRQARALNPGRRAFFKRDYGARGSRKSSVKNV